MWAPQSRAFSGDGRTRPHSVRALKDRPNTLSGRSSKRALCLQNSKSCLFMWAKSRPSRWTPKRGRVCVLRREPELEDGRHLRHRRGHHLLFAELLRLQIAEVRGKGVLCACVLSPLLGLRRTKTGGRLRTLSLAQRDCNNVRRVFRVRHTHKS